MNRAECQRCGFTWQVRSLRKVHPFCISCRAEPVRSIMTEKGKCVPWQGKYDLDQITPITDDGDQVLPGRRTCGNRDCVNQAHVEKE